MSQSFIKTTENFTCEHCGTEVIGNGYTNHCPKCLWSKHVDVNPGDRGAACEGLMRPVQIRMEKGKFRITHQCQVCGYEKTNTAAPGDNIAALLP